MNKTQAVISQAVLACALSAASLSAGTVSYDNTGDWGGNTTMGSWGTSGNTATYGETFTAPAGTVSLDAYTFYIKNNESAEGTLTYEAAVYAWDTENGHITGSALLKQNFAFAYDGSFQALTVYTGGVALNAGEVYVAFLTLSDPVSDAANNSKTLDLSWAFIGASTINDGGGEFVYYNNTSYSQLTDGTTWDGVLSGYGPVVWKADFTVSSVPEPTTMALVGLGLVGLIAYRRPLKK